MGERGGREADKVIASVGADARVWGEDYTAGGGDIDGFWEDDRLQERLQKGRKEVSVTEQRKRIGPKGR